MATEEEIEQINDARGVSSLDAIPIANSREFLAVLLKQSISNYFQAAYLDSPGNEKELLTNLEGLITEGLQNNLRNVEENHPKTYKSVKKTHDILLKDVKSLAKALHREISVSVEKEIYRIMTSDPATVEREKQEIQSKTEIYQELEREIAALKKSKENPKKLEEAKKEFKSISGRLSKLTVEHQVREAYESGDVSQAKLSAATLIANQSTFMDAAVNLLKKEVKSVARDPKKSFRMQVAESFEKWGCTGIADRLRESFYKSQHKAETKQLSSRLKKTFNISAIKKAFVQSKVETFSGLETPTAINPMHAGAQRANSQSGGR